VSESLVLLGFLMITVRFLEVGDHETVSVLRFLAPFIIAPMPFVIIVI